MERDVERVVALERDREKEGTGWKVDRVEASFTVPGIPPLPSFRGRVDRLDRGPSGEARVVDYKYSDPKYGDPRRGPASADWIGHGLAHQVPLYISWARTLDPAPSSVSAVLYFLRNDFGEQPAPAWEEVRDSWASSLSDWLGIAASGTFPPLPHHRFRYGDRSDAPRYCDACPFKDHCRVSPAFDGSEVGSGALASAIAREPALGSLAAHRPGKG